MDFICFANLKGFGGRGKWRILIDRIVILFLVRIGPCPALAGIFKIFRIFRMERENNSVNSVNPVNSRRGGTSSDSDNNGTQTQGYKKGHFPFVKTILKYLDTNKPNKQCTDQPYAETPQNHNTPGHPQNKSTLYSFFIHETYYPILFDFFSDSDVSNRSTSPNFAEF